MADGCGILEWPGIYISCGALARYPVFSKRVKVLPLNEADAEVPIYVAWGNNEKSRPVLDFLQTVSSTFEAKAT